MKEYIKPTFDIVELRIDEEINTQASVSYYKKDSNGWTAAQLKQMALQSFDEGTASNF
jgi:hypothetical protein